MLELVSTIDSAVEGECHVEADLARVVAVGARKQTSSHRRGAAALAAVTIVAVIGVGLSLGARSGRSPVSVAAGPPTSGSAPLAQVSSQGWTTERDALPGPVVAATSGPGFQLAVVHFGAGYDAFTAEGSAQWRHTGHVTDGDLTSVTVAAASSTPSGFIVAGARGSEPVIWVSGPMADQWTEEALPAKSGGLINAIGITASGEPVLAGVLDSRPVTIRRDGGSWIATDMPLADGRTPAYGSANAMLVSANRLLVGGTAEGTPVVWIADTGSTSFTPIQLSPDGTVLALSQSGARVVAAGQSQNASAIWMTESVAAPSFHKSTNPPGLTETDVPFRGGAGSARGLILVTNRATYQSGDGVTWAAIDQPGTGIPVARPDGFTVVAPTTLRWSAP